MAGCGGGGSNLSRGKITDIDVLNFALNLEYLEAEFYLRATTGAGLSAGDAGTGAGTVVGGTTAVPFTTNAFQQYATEIAADELAHVRFLRTALGASAVARPNIDFTNAFNAAAVAAGIGATFDPFADETSFLLGAFVFEDLGVTAYRGGAALIDDRATFFAATGIMGTEAYHAAIIRAAIYGIGGAAVTNAQKISDLRDSEDGSTDIDQGVTEGSNANLVPTDVNGLPFIRNSAQVLKIAYLGGNTSGGFFPNGMNGVIK